MQYENIYVGRRYVPLYCGNWEDSKEYEALSIVLYTDGNSYTSIKPVPAGIVPTNDSYWALTGQGNTAISEATEKITEIGERVEKLETVVPENGWYTIDHYGIKNDGYTNNYSVFKTIPSKEGVILRPGTYLINNTDDYNSSISCKIYVCPGAYLKTTSGRNLSLENIVAGDYQIVNTDDVKKISLYSANGEGLNVKWYGSWDAAKQIIDNTSWAPVISGLSGSLSGGGNYYIPDSSILISNPYRSINSMEDTANIICKGRAKFDTVSFQMSANKEILTFFNFSQQTKKDLSNPVVFNNCRFNCNTGNSYRVEKGSAFENFGTLIFEKCYFMVNTKLTENLLFFKNCDTVIFRDCSFTDLGNTLTGNFILSENTNNFTFDNCQIKASETATFLHENNTGTWDAEKAERIFNGVYTDNKINNFFVSSMEEGYTSEISGVSFKNCYIKCVNEIFKGDFTTLKVNPTVKNYSNNYFYSENKFFDNPFEYILFDGNVFDMSTPSKDYEAFKFTNCNLVFKDNIFFDNGLTQQYYPTFTINTPVNVNFIRNMSKMSNIVGLKLVLNNAVGHYIGFNKTEFREVEGIENAQTLITKEMVVPYISDVTFGYYGKAIKGDTIPIDPEINFNNGYSLNYSALSTPFQECVKNVRLMGNYKDGTTFEYDEAEKKWDLKIDSNETVDKIFISYDFTYGKNLQSGGTKIGCFEVMQNSSPVTKTILSVECVTNISLEVNQGGTFIFDSTLTPLKFLVSYSDGTYKSFDYRSATKIYLIGRTDTNTKLDDILTTNVHIGSSENADSILLVFRDDNFPNYSAYLPVKINKAAG